MTKYEELLQEACDEGIYVEEKYKFASERLKGLYGDKVIALSKDLGTDAERASIVAEELGHYYTTTGDITDQSNAANRKQEHRARAWVYEELISPQDLIDAFEAGCRSRQEVAEKLEITEQLLTDALAYYKAKYGQYVRCRQYTIIFEPAIGIIKKF